MEERSEEKESTTTRSRHENDNNQIVENGGHDRSLHSVLDPSTIPDLRFQAQEFEDRCANQQKHETSRNNNRQQATCTLAPFRNSNRIVRKGKQTVGMDSQENKTATDRSLDASQSSSSSSCQPVQAVGTRREMDRHPRIRKLHATTTDESDDVVIEESIITEPTAATNFAPAKPGLATDKKTDSKTSGLGKREAANSERTARAHREPRSKRKLGSSSSRLAPSPRIRIETRKHQEKSSRSHIHKDSNASTCLSIDELQKDSPSLTFRQQRQLFITLADEEMGSLNDSSAEFDRPGAVRVGSDRENDCRLGASTTEPTSQSPTVPRPSRIPIAAELVSDASLEQIEEERDELKRRLEEFEHQPAVVATKNSPESKEARAPNLYCAVLMFLATALVIAILVIVTMDEHPSRVAPPTDSVSVPTLMFNRTETILANVYPDISSMSDLSRNTIFALDWLASDDIDESVIDEKGDIVHIDLLLERFALAKFYFDLHGSQWYFDSKWLSHAHGICDWFGTACNVHGQLTHFQGADGKFQGYLPSEIALLKKLVVVDWADNSIRGTLPTEMGLLSNLESVELHSNQLTGVIPTELGFLNKLNRLDLDENCLTGTFPTQLGLLTNLKDLYMSTNIIQGDLNPLFCHNHAHFPIPPNIITDCDLEGVTCDCCQSCCNHSECRGDGYVYDVSRPKHCWTNHNDDEPN